MTFDARSQGLDTRSTEVDASRRACGSARAAATPRADDDETTVVRLAGDRDGRGPQAYDDDVTVLRIARRARQHS